MSLGQLSGEAAVIYDNEITKQGLDSRFDDKAVCYVKSILGEVIANQIAAIQRIVFFAKVRLFVSLTAIRS